MITPLWAFSSLDWINPVLSLFLHVSHSPTSSCPDGPPLDELQFFSFSWTEGNQHWVLPTSCLPSLMSSIGTFFSDMKMSLKFDLGRDKIDPPFLLFPPFLYSCPSLLEYFGVCFDLHFISNSLGTSHKKYLEIRNKLKSVLLYFY